MKLGEFIRKYREEQGISQRQLAAMSGLSNAYISILENEKNQDNGKPIRSYRLTSLKALAHGMGYNLDTLLELVDETPIETELPPTMEVYPDLLKILHRLNDDGVRRVISLARDIAENPKYEKNKKK